ncbi:MAG: HD-GYP domain-containing protein [Candidatus Zixiibacteriota bacterium]
MNDTPSQVPDAEIGSPQDGAEFNPAEGAPLLTMFFGLPKTLRLVGHENDTFKNQLGKFWERFESFSRGAPKLTIKIVNGRLFINDELCRAALKSEVVQDAVDRWTALGIGGVEILYQPESSGLATLFGIINNTKELANSEEIQLRLADAQVSGIRVLSAEEVQEDPELSEENRIHMRRQARSVFFQSMRTIDEATSRVLSSREVSLRQTKRVVHSLVDQLMTQDSALLELTAIKDFDDYTFAHSVNVCIFSLSIGVNMHLDRRRLSQLGFAALFHDVGKTKLPSDVIKKPDEFNDDDWAMMRRHPTLGAKMLLRNFPISVHTIRGALAAFEHHINIDGTGYPRRPQERDLNLFSRIVTVADTYDALTSGRVYIKNPIPPIEVMRKMFYQMDNKFDQLIIKVFINSIGLFPAGTLVVLSDDRLAIVEQISSVRPDSPVVRVIGDRTGLSQVAELIDLAASENDQLKIKRFLNPQAYNIDLKHFILNDLPVE